VHGHGVGADPVDPRAERDEEVGEVLHVRLARGVAEDGGALRGDGRHERVLGAGDARLVEEDVGAAELGRLHLDDVGELVRRAELFECEEVRVEPAPADHVAPGRRERDAAAPAQDRAREEDRAADALGERAVEVRRNDLLGVHVYGVAAGPRDLDAERRDQVTSVSRSRMRGTFSSVTGWSVSNAAATIGSAAFLFPDGRMVPESG
jgi:hypothetical protein